jgi:hypothetical protein
MPRRTTAQNAVRNAAEALAKKIEECRKKGWTDAQLLMYVESWIEHARRS